MQCSNYYGKIQHMNREYYNMHTYVCTILRCMEEVRYMLVCRAHQVSNMLPHDNKEDEIIALYS